VEIDSTPELVSRVYKKLQENIEKYRKLVGRPLTLTEKLQFTRFHFSVSGKGMQF